MTVITSGGCSPVTSRTIDPIPTSTAGDAPTKAFRRSDENIAIPHARGKYVDTMATRTTIPPSTHQIDRVGHCRSPLLLPVPEDVNSWRGPLSTFRDVCTAASPEAICLRWRQCPTRTIHRELRAVSPQDSTRCRKLPKDGLTCSIRRARRQPIRFDPGQLADQGCCRADRRRCPSDRCRRRWRARRRRR